MTTPLADVTYETRESLTLSVADMLSLLLALHDARHYNEDKGFDALAKAVRALELRIRPQIDALIAEADRKVSVAMGKEPTFTPLKAESATLKPLRHAPHDPLLHPNDYRD